SLSGARRHWPGKNHCFFLGIDPDSRRFLWELPRPKRRGCSSVAQIDGDVLIVASVLLGRFRHHQEGAVLSGSRFRNLRTHDHIPLCQIEPCDASFYRFKLWKVRIEREVISEVTTSKSANKIVSPSFV